MPQLPKLSYVLLSHNREKYIRAAIESAFAQDYEGELEYIFSDDCSTDRTFEIIKECVAAYKGGRRVVVTQTPTNLRSAGNFNHALSFAQGDWIIRADDDDISSVDRCTLTAWAIAQAPGCMFVGICSKYPFADEHEQEIILRSREKHHAGGVPLTTDIYKDSIDRLKYNFKNYCYLTWNMEIYRQFGDLPMEAALADDYIYFFRASVMGKGAYLPDTPLYFIRRGSHNQSSGNSEGKATIKSVIEHERFLKRYSSLTKAALLKTRDEMDRYIPEHFGQDAYRAAEPFRKYVEEKITSAELLEDYWRKSFVYRYRANRFLGYTSLYGLLRCLPMPAYATILTVIRKLKGKS